MHHRGEFAISARELAPDEPDCHQVIPAAVVAGRGMETEQDQLLPGGLVGDRQRQGDRGGHFHHEPLQEERGFSAEDQL